MTIEIELITTKKKLSKSILNQMEYVLPLDLAWAARTNFFGVLGYYIDKNTRVAIIKILDEYKRIELYDWRKSDKELNRKDGFSVNFIPFDNNELRDDYFENYNKLKEIALKTHIYV